MKPASSETHPSQHDSSGSPSKGMSFGSDKTEFVMFFCPKWLRSRARSTVFGSSSNSLWGDTNLGWLTSNGVKPLCYLPESGLPYPINPPQRPHSIIFCALDGLMARFYPSPANHDQAWKGKQRLQGCSGCLSEAILTLLACLLTLRRLSRLETLRST